MVVVRLATADDVRVLHGREPDAHDMEYLATSRYLVVARADGDGSERVVSRRSLSDDDGELADRIAELTGAVEA